jgi:hypothetical protein
METGSNDEDRLPAHIDQVHQRLENLDGNEDQKSVAAATEQASPVDQSDKMGRRARRRRSSAARSSSMPGRGIRRTTYWAFGKPVSLAYIPALADEHPETINDERAAPPLYHRRPTVPGGRLIEVKNPASPATKRDAEGIGWGR